MCAIGKAGGLEREIGTEELFKEIIAKHFLKNNIRYHTTDPGSSENAVEYGSNQEIETTQQINRVKFNIKNY